MRFALVEREGAGAGSYVMSDSAQEPLRTEEDVMDVIAAAWEHGVNKVMLQEQALSDEFFQLRTGLAGLALQKFVNYQIRTAAVISNEAAIQGRAREMVTELNKGRDFRVFASMADAEAWLLAD
jgi:hypothetical protein